MDEATTYLAVIRLGEQPDRARIVEAARHTKRTIEGLSDGDCVVAFTTPSADVFAWFLNTERSAGEVCDALYTIRGSSTPLLNSDSVLVLPIARGIAAQGFSKAWNWLDHHRPS